jgi:cation-transporting ATPase 13A1
LQTSETGEEVIWFKFQKLKYIYDAEEKKEFLPVDFPVDHSIEYYKTAKGYQEESEITEFATKYGKNK